MRGKQKIVGGIILVFAATVLAMMPQHASSRPVRNFGQEATAEPVPAFHASVPAGPLPATLSPSLFADPVAQNAYSVAAHIKKILYQQPCYCHCDQSQGHGSLLDCFVSKHGSGCNICINEDFYSYEQTRKGKTPAQIRAGIIKGEWQSLDVTPYRKPILAN